MKKDKPKKHVQSAEGNRNIRQTTFDFPGLDIPDNPSDVPVVSAFFAWDILDEFGEPETVSLSYRVSKFLKAIYNEVVADSHITVEGKSEQEVQEYVTTTQGNPLVSELVQNFRLIFQLYVPKEPNTASEPIEMYWGAVYEIAEVRHLFILEFLSKQPLTNNPRDSLKMSPCIHPCASIQRWFLVLYFMRSASIRAFTACDLSKILRPKSGAGNMQWPKVPSFSLW